MSKAEASVQELVAMIERGELQLPEMQRRYVWRSTRVRDLLDSLYRGWPSGAILVWETDEDVPLQDFAVKQSANPYATTRLLLDGQQRLTSLSAVIRGEPLTVRGRQRPIEILFNLEHPDRLAVVTEVNEDSEDEEVAEDTDSDSNEDELQTRINKMAFVVATKKLAALPHWVKVSDVFRTEEDVPFLRRAGVTDLGDPRVPRYSQRLARLRGIRDYMYRMDVLERSMRYEDVTEIFVRVNSLGAKLRSSDLALAQITAKWRGALTEFLTFQEMCAKRGFNLELAIHLKALIAFATAQSRFHSVGGLSRPALEDAWKKSREGMEFAVNFLKTNARIESPALLSSPFLMVTLAYYGYRRGYHLTGSEADRLRFWVRLANAKGRYSRGSSETILDQDLATIRDGGTVEAMIDRLRLQVGRLDVTPDELRGRNQRSALFKTMFLAFREQGARDWNSNLEISLDHTGLHHTLQFHHIFPKALLAKLDRTSRDADDIANLAFISGSTNRRIGDKAPAVYLADVPAPDREAFYRTQCVPSDPDILAPDNYTAFLATRRELIAERLNEYLGTTGHLEMSPPRDPHLARLDERIEIVELQLRRLIGERLGDSRRLPRHILDAIIARRAADHRRNPGLAAGADQEADLLSYCDLRELQDVLTNKDLWPLWAAAFGTKEQLNSRFAQLTALRNALRHSRSPDDVTTKDGEAALLWFAGALVEPRD
jgi:hypothetical protein